MLLSEMDLRSLLPKLKCLRNENRFVRTTPYRGVGGLVLSEFEREVLPGSVSQEIREAREAVPREVGSAARKRRKEIDMTSKKPWSHDSPFLLGSAAVQLYRRMMLAPWRTCDGDENEQAIHYGLSYTQGPDGQDGEIPVIPDFLKALAERVAENKHVQMPANYIQCHRMGPDAQVQAHHDPTGMIVPTVTLGQERTFRVGGTYDDSIRKTDRTAECHIPEEEYLMKAGDLLTFIGNRTAHSMDFASKDPNFNANGYDYRISILFRWTTRVMREMGPVRKNWSRWQVEQHEDEYRAVQEKWIREHQAQGVLF